MMSRERLERGLSNIIIIVFALGIIAVLALVYFLVRKPNTVENASTPPSTATASALISPTTEATLSAAEIAQIKPMADVFIKKNSIAGLKYTLVFRKRVGDYALFNVIPAPGVEIDPAMLLVKNTPAGWQIVNFGTDFPEEMQQMPQLFQ